MAVGTGKPELEALKQSRQLTKRLSVLAIKHPQSLKVQSFLFRIFQGFVSSSSSSPKISNFTVTDSEEKETTPGRTEGCLV